MAVKLVIGLGNPGARYRNTYHNVGHLAIDYFESQKENLRSQISNLQLIKTDCFMNESGAFVRAALRKRRLKPGELLLAHDDSDIALGSYKISFGRGAAGHRGVADVIAALGAADFSRLRIGVRRDRSQGKAERFVLRRITEPDRATLEAAFSAAAADLARMAQMAAARETQPTGTQRSTRRCRPGSP